MMTLTPFMIYLAGIASSVKTFLLILSVGHGLFAWLTLMASANDVCPIKVPVGAAVLAAVLGLFAALTPSTKTIAAMYVLPAVVNSEAVQKLPAEATSLALEWLKELRKERKK